MQGFCGNLSMPIHTENRPMPCLLKKARTLLSPKFQPNQFTMIFRLLIFGEFCVLIGRQTIRVKYHTGVMPCMNAHQNKQQRVCLLSLILLMTLLVTPDWQASGNMTDYLPTIRGFLEVALESAQSSTLIDDIPTNISNECNNEWDQFWNVFIVTLNDATKDAILYGYAFRSHWYWHNNYNPNKQSFLIWKDYHCISPFTSHRIMTFDDHGIDQLRNSILSAQSAKPDIVDDPWLWAHDAIEEFFKDAFATALSKSSSEIGVTAVMVNEKPYSTEGRFCHSYSFYQSFSSSSPSPYYIFVYVSRLD